MDQYNRRGKLVAAGVVLGVGIGLLTHNVGAWTLIGLAAGLVAAYFARRSS